MPPLRRASSTSYSTNTKVRCRQHYPIHFAHAYNGARLIDPDGDDINIDGTIKLCEDLSVDPEDVVLLAIAYELKSPSMGEWTRKEWVDGWKSIGCVKEWFRLRSCL